MKKGFVLWQCVGFASTGFLLFPFHFVILWQMGPCCCFPAEEVFVLKDRKRTKGSNAVCEMYLHIEEINGLFRHLVCVCVLCCAVVNAECVNRTAASCPCRLIIIFVHVAGLRPSHGAYKTSTFSLQSKLNNPACVAW